jgi:hypothetical protein
MFRNRFLILLGVCFLAASAAWADEVGYIDCSGHSEGTQVFGKPRKSPDVVASLPCGERFTILVYGFVFSRIETRDAKVGYVYSNLIAVDHSGNPVLQPASERVRIPAAKPAAPATATVAQPKPSEPAQPQPSPAQVTPVQSAAAPASDSTPAVSASPAVSSPAVTSSVSETTAPVAQPAPLMPTPPQPAPPPPAPAAALAPAPEPASSASMSAAAASPAAAAPAPIAKAPEAPAAIAQPEPPAAAQPQPTPAQPAPPAIRPAETRTQWERPHPGARRPPLVELFGGYAFLRQVGAGGTATNLNGAMGSFGWNLKPWLQIVADSSYNFITVGSTKNVLYGNHYGPRYFYRRQNRWGITPFAEALFGASRADTTISGSGGYTTSTNSLSFKVGGGLDIRPSRHFEIRLFDVDYYRTSFGTNLHQNNYWASAGIVIRLFGGGSDY